MTGTSVALSLVIGAGLAVVLAVTTLAYLRADLSILLEGFAFCG